MCSTFLTTSKKLNNLDEIQQHVDTYALTVDWLTEELDKALGEYNKVPKASAKGKALLLLINSLTAKAEFELLEAKKLTKQITEIIEGLD